MAAANGCYICAPLTADTVQGVLAQMEKATKIGADVVEIRLDFLKDFEAERDLPVLLGSRTVPAIVTYRPKWEGGLYEGEEGPRQAALQKAIDLGVDFIDVELQVAESFIASRPTRHSDYTPAGPNFSPLPTRIIVSNHNWTHTPSFEDLAILVARMQATGADIVKIATTANDICDVALTFQLLERVQVPIIALSMGPRGEISRLLAPKFGGFLTFATLEAGQETAPGQPTVSDLLNVYHIKRVGRLTKVFGVIANPVRHSKSPLLHNAAMAAVGFDGVYVPLLVDDVNRFFKVFDTPDFVGYSVTIPHKQTVLPLCQEVDDVAKAIGAVNNVVRRADGSLAARNTDWNACTAAIEDGLRAAEGPGADPLLSPLAGRLLVVVGAGGSGRALAFGAKRRGATLVLADDDQERAKEIAAIWSESTVPMADLQRAGAARAMKERFGAHLGPEPPLLAHMTPVGMFPNDKDTLFTREMLRGYVVVFDAVYTPARTALLQEAEEANCTAVSGVEMFIRQAAEQFTLFTGLPAAPEHIMRQIVTEEQRSSQTLQVAGTH